MATAEDCSIFSERGQAPAAADPAIFAAIEPEQICRVGDWIGLSPSIQAALISAAEELRSDESLRALLWQCYWTLFVQGGYPHKRIGLWPTPTRWFYALLCLAAVPHMRALHAQRGIPEPITQATLADLSRWIEEHRRRHGTEGFSAMDWMVRHLSGRVYSLGRLQFEVAHFRQPIVPPGLKAGEAILRVHVPAGGPLVPAACDASFALAMEFFPRHFPEHVFKAFTCEGWLMDRQLAQYLPADSNLLRFQRRWTAYELADGDGRQILERVCGSEADWQRNSTDTTLRRIVAEHLRRGGQWRSAGGLIVREGFVGD